MKNSGMWQAVAIAALTVGSISLEQARAGIVFGTPSPGPRVNSSDSEFDPSISAGGRELYFQSGRPGGQGDSDLYVATRATTKDDRDQAADLGPIVNSEFHELNPSVSADGRTLYFASGRDGSSGFSDL